MSDGESAPVFSGALAAGARRRGGRSLGGSEHGSFWDKARGAFGGKDGKDCDCKWCRTLGSGRYRSTSTMVEEWIVVVVVDGGPGREESWDIIAVDGV